MRRKCSRCKKSKPLSSGFYPSHVRRGKAAWCKTCHTEYNRALGRATPGYWFKYKKKYFERDLKIISDLKAAVGCVKCPERDPVCLDYHHPDKGSKVADVRWLLNRGNMAKVLLEIAKCIVLCANCHRKTHDQERHHV